MIVIAFPLAFFVREPAGGREAPRRRPAAGAAAPDSILDVLRQPAFYLLALGSMASIGAVGGTMQNLKLYFSHRPRAGPGRGRALISLVLVGSLVGRLLMGWLADRWPKKQVMLLIYLDRGRHDPAALSAPSPATPARPLAVAVRRRARRRLHDHPAHGGRAVRPAACMGRLMGVVLTADGVAEAVVPMAVAALRDRSAATPPASPCSRPGVGARPPCRRARGRARSSPPFTIRPETDKIRPWQDTLDPRSTSVSARPARKGKAGGQGGAPRPARGRQKAEGPDVGGGGSGSRRHRPRPAGPSLGGRRADELGARSPGARPEETR